MQVFMYDRVAGMVLFLLLVFWSVNRRLDIKWQLELHVSYLPKGLERSLPFVDNVVSLFGILTKRHWNDQNNSRKFRRWYLLSLFGICCLLESSYSTAVIFLVDRHFRFAQGIRLPVCRACYLR